MQVHLPFREVSGERASVECTGEDTIDEVQGM